MLSVPTEALESLEAEPELLALAPLPDFPERVALVLLEALAELLELALAPFFEASTEVCDEAEPDVCVFAEVCATAVANSRLDASNPDTTIFMSIPPERLLFTIFLNCWNVWGTSLATYDAEAELLTA